MPTHRKSATVFANGPIADYSGLMQCIAQDSMIVAVDGGLRHARALSLMPDILIGDLDSVTAEMLENLPPETQVVTFPSEKEATDLELALSMLDELHIKKLLLAGFSGGRLDHQLANIFLLRRQTWRFEFSLWYPGGSGRLINGPAQEVIQNCIGRTVSLIPLSEHVKGIDFTGVEYPLHNASLDFSSTRGISNVVLTDAARLSLKQGSLLLLTNEQM